MVCQLVCKSYLKCAHTDEKLFPDELKPVIRSGGTGTSSTSTKLILDDFLDIANEEETFEKPDDEPPDLERVDIIQSDVDDELQQGARDADADEDLEEDDYGSPPPIPRIDSF